MPPDLKAEVWAELKAGQRIREAYLSHDTEHLDGLCEGGLVTVNPVPSVVETCAHEILHRIRPRWGERRVYREARKLLASMGDTEVRKWYRTFQRVAVKRQTVKVED
jgi:hypothetical protein